MFIETLENRRMFSITASFAPQAPITIPSPTVVQAELCKARDTPPIASQTVTNTVVKKVADTDSTIEQNFK